MEFISIAENGDYRKDNFLLKLLTKSDILSGKMSILETTLVVPITNINFNSNLKYLADNRTCNLILFHLYIWKNSFKMKVLQKLTIFILQQFACIYNQCTPYYAVYLFGTWLTKFKSDPNHQNIVLQNKPSLCLKMLPEMR